MLLNLISNGFYAATKRQAKRWRRLEPTLTATTRNLGDSVEIRIRDNGTGIPPEVKERMFNPFFTTKPAGEGPDLASPSVTTSLSSSMAAPSRSTPRRANLPNSRSFCRARGPRSSKRESARETFNRDVAWTFKSHLILPARFLTLCNFEHPNRIQKFIV